MTPTTALWCTICLLLPSRLVIGAETLPAWIWGADETGDVSLSEEFNVVSPRNGELKIAGDFCIVRVSINDRDVLVLEDARTVATVDVTDAVHAGQNEIRLVAEAIPGPSAIALVLTIQETDGPERVLSANPSWQVTPGPAVSHGTVAAEYWGVGGRSIEISPFEDYTQWKRALGDEAEESGQTFLTAPGFTVESVRAAQPDEDSWISLAFDDAGRITVGQEKRGLLRLTLSGSGAVESVERVNESLEECRGLQYVGSELYVTANNSKAIYRLRDTDGDDNFDESTVLKELSGGVGHGRNQLTRGPDGNLYLICGDSVDIPTDVQDRTSPFREARRGQQTSEGYLLKFDPAGENWEVICAGLRNPFGVAFSESGDAFTYDADAEFDMGSPWYRPTRVVQLVSGADYGWRGVTGSWPPYVPDHPDNAQPVFDIGKGSPTAVAFGYDSHFPPRYRDALYILDWAYGRVVAVHLRPHGAGFSAQAETFLQGRPLNVCDVEFGPDGAMYLVTGGRGTKSGLYRVRFEGDHGPSSHRSRQDERLAEYSETQRTLRRRIEQWHAMTDANAVDQIWPHLGAADDRIRYSARTALEHQPVDSWSDRALAESETETALAALTALVRSGEFDADRMLARLLEFPFAELRLSQQLSLLALYGWALDQSAPSDGHCEAIIRRCDTVATMDDPVSHISVFGTERHLLREATRLLLRLDAPDAVDVAIRCLKGSATQEDRMHYLFLLRDVTDGWTSESQETYLHALADTREYIGGEGMPKFLQQIRDAVEARLDDDGRELLARLTEPEPQAPVKLESRPVVQKWTIDDFASDVAARKGDAARGAEVFRDALCARCHRVGATGPAIGPDLTFVARRFSRQDILLSILKPARVVAENYRNVEVVTTDGRVVVGRPVTAGDYRSPTLRIAIDPLDATQIVEIPKEEMDVFRVGETSPMPEGLLDRFRREEILDLLAYLEAGLAVH